MGTSQLPARAVEILQGTPIAFMTTMRPDGRMSTNPVAVIFDGQRVRVSTEVKRWKYRNLVADNRVTLCVVQPSNLNRYVEIRGRATIEADPDRTFIDSIAQRYMGVDHYPFDKPGDQRVTITVDIEAVACPDVPLSDNPPYQ